MLETDIIQNINAFLDESEQEENNKEEDKTNSSLKSKRNNT